MVRYSSVCETDGLAYLLYLCAVAAKENDGSAVERVIGELGGECVGESVGGGAGVGGDFAGVFGRVCASAKGAGFDFCDGVTSARGSGSVDRVVVGSESGSSQGVVRLAICNDGSVGRRVGSSSGIGVVGNDGRGSAAGEVDAASEASGRGLVSDALSESFLAGKTGRARRKAKRRLKVFKEKENAVEDVLEVSAATPVKSVDSSVPEWRRKNPKAPVHRGVFSDCSEEVRRRLVDTRAEMLVAKNEAAKVKAEVETRRTKALLKSQEVERSVELKRLKTEAGLKVEVERKFGVNYSSGFAQTVVSEGLTDVISVPSLDGSVSPDSSISVDGVRKLESAVARLSQENSELKTQVGALLKGGSVVEKPRRDFQNSFEEELAAWEAMGRESSYHEGLTGLGEDDIRESEAIFDRTRANGFMSSADKVRNDAINAKVVEFRRLEKLAKVDES